MVTPLDPRDYTDPYIANYSRVPPAGSGVCPVCHSGPHLGLTICSSCVQTMGQVTQPTDLVVPISLYEVQGQLWHTLRYYKDGPTEDTRRNFGTHVAATLARFLDRHRGCIERRMQSPFTVVTTVPSSGSRAGIHPLETAVRRVSSISALYRTTLRKGPVPITHNSANDRGYEVVTPVSGEHILLIEDTFTSGARTQSAASALQLAGATEVAVLVVGRVIYPSWNDACSAIWAARHPFTFDRCCLE